MKKYLVIASVLAFSFGAYAQKKQLKDADKAIDKAMFADAEAYLASAKSTALANKKYAAEYHYLLGKMGVEKTKKNLDVVNSLTQATQGFGESLKISKAFASEIQKLKQEAKNVAIVQGQEAYKTKNYKKASPIFEQVFRMIPQDTLFLYNAAITSAQGKDYSRALNLYSELKDLGYTGAEMIYTAKNKETKKVEQFATKEERDLMVKGKTHSDPKDEKTPSRKAEIIKNIALIYVELGDKDAALKAFADARKAYPKDVDLVIQEANVYIQLDNKDKFKELMKEATELAPDNPDLHYNIGVISLQQNDFEGARKAFEKTLSIKPDYADAALNISTTYINEGNTLVEKMNKLGSTRKEIKEYDQLKAQKEELFRKSASILEEYTKKQGKNKEILEQLRNIYVALDDVANVKRIKAML